MAQSENIAKLKSEIEELKSRLSESQETLNAIRNGEVDAIIVSGNNGDKVFSLASAETPYRIIIEEMEEGALTVSEKGIILYSNPRFSEIISVSLEKIPGSDFSEFIAEEDGPEFKRLLRNALKRPVRGEVNATVNQKTAHLQLSLVPLPESMEGSVCIIVSDITEISDFQNYLQEMVDERTEKLKIANRQLSDELHNLKRAEKALERSEESYFLAVKAASLGTWDHLYDGKKWKVVWSDQIYRIFGFQPGTKVGMKSYLERLHPLDRDRVNAEYNGAIKSRGNYDCEYRIVLPDKTIKWIHSTGKVTDTEEAGTVLRITGVSRDITKRKDAEKLLLESEERYRLLSDTMTQGVIYRDAEGIIISINPAGEQIIGKSAAEIIGKKIAVEMMTEDGSVVEFANLPSQRTLRYKVPVLGEITSIFNQKEKTRKWISIDTIPLYRKDEDRPYQIYSVFEDITQRMLAEKEIQKREQLFRSAFDDGSVPMTLTSKEGVFLKVNHAFCQLTGYSAEELTGMSFQHLTHPDDLEPSIKGSEELKSNDLKSFRMEKRYIRKDGHPVWVSISTAPVRDEKGNWDFFVTHIQDINKRKNAEFKLKESKEKFKQLANSITQLAWIARSDGYIFWFNKRWYEYTGRTQDDMIGWGWQKVQDPKMLPLVMKRYRESIVSGKPFEMIFPILGKDGEYREFLTKSIPFRDKKGNIDQWFGTNTDISDLKKIENELKDSREKLRIALENGRIGTWEWNPGKEIFALDERAEKMLNISHGSFGGTYNDFLNCIHEEDLPHVRKAMEYALSSQDVFETIFRTRPVCNASNYISAKALVTRDSDNFPFNIAGVCFDVTSMKKGAEQALIKLNEELLRSNTDLQQFAYVASHDLQEPLRMVSSFTQLLQYRYADKLDADGNEYIRFAVEGSKRMYELLNGLLTYSRIQTRGKDFHLVDMKDVVAKVRDNLKLVIQEKKATIVTNDLPVVFADESQMIQVMQNLIENSLKFMQGPPVITVSSVKGEHSDIISVEDNGIGIENQYFERIFKIFQRLHRSEEYAGTGIGLAICRRIIERHGGKIWIKSAPGTGSTFSFSIPHRISNPHSEQ
jgi:PAS domain S-box-containing protein